MKLKTTRSNPRSSDFRIDTALIEVGYFFQPLSKRCSYRNRVSGLGRHLLEA
jgi:hypothetical protein